MSFHITHNEPIPECSAIEFAEHDLRVQTILYNGARQLGASVDELCRLAIERGNALTARRRAHYANNVRVGHRGGWH